jgi:two-component system nitrogen regulation response regulator NtrX
MSGDGNGARVLLVDDEIALLEEMRDFLAWNDMSVTTAGDGREALAMLATDGRITVVLSDIAMPSLDGMALATKIREDYGAKRATEIVLMSGHGSPEAVAAAKRNGAFDLLRKPMVLTDVLAVLRRAHARAMARRDSAETQS